MDPQALAGALEASQLGAWMRGSPWAYPVTNLVHLLGLVLLVGPMLLLDLRLLGFGQRMIRADVASVLLTRWAVAGLLLMLGSGALLFAADAAPLLNSRLLQAKVALIAFGILNALLFRALWNRELDDWDLLAPLTGRLQALLSAVCWLTAATLGRLIAYS